VTAARGHPPYVTVGRLAALCDVGNTSVHRWVREGLLKGERQNKGSGRAYRIPTAGLEFLPPPGDFLVRPAMALEALGLTESQLQTLARQRRLHAYRLPSGRRRYSGEEIRAMNLRRGAA
jgi:DNA-binding transcriptional MerR regulator